jgi:hypothetical protein
MAERKKRSMITACTCCGTEIEEKHRQAADKVTLDYNFCKECLTETRVLIEAGEEALLNLGRMEQILKQLIVVSNVSHK